MTDQQYLTPPQAAKVLRVASGKVLTLIANGELRATNLSLGLVPRWRIAPADLQAMLDRRSNQQQRPERRRTKPAETKRNWV